MADFDFTNQSVSGTVCSFIAKVTDVARPAGFSSFPRQKRDAMRGRIVFVSIFKHYDK